MITEIFPQDFQRYQSLPVLGPLMDRYADWLHDSSIRGGLPDTSCVWPLASPST